MKTIKFIFKIPFNHLGRLLNLPLVLPFSIGFAVTHRCNSRCKTCGIWRYPQTEEMKLEQIERLFYSLGKSLYWITLTGGEPFLRDDFVDICKIIYSNCKPAFINIATNGSLPEKIVSDMEKVLKFSSKTKFKINLSLDGINKGHDNIRRLNANFDCLYKTYQGLSNIRNRRLHIGINTVVSKYNIGKVEDMITFIKNHFKFTPYYFEIAQLRDELKNQGLLEILPHQQESITLFKKLYSSNNTRKFDLEQYTINRLRNAYYKLVVDTLLLKYRVIVCFSGFASVYILPGGEVWACCVQKKLLGNLKHYNFDFKKLWWSKDAQFIRKNIKENDCFCMQVNANYLNIIHNPGYLINSISL